jgi:hypothetical protein
MNQHCPHCDKVIFQARGLDGQAFGADPAAPQVYQNGADLYADCPSCGQPVKMKPAPAETGVEFVVSHNQK